MGKENNVATINDVYEIYVSDPKGWDIDCPDSKGIFFSPEPGEEYIHMVDGGHEECGSLIVTGHRAAKARLNDLRTTGDWWYEDDDGKKHFKRPSYGMRRYRPKSKEV